MVDLPQSTKNQQGGKLMGIAKLIKNLRKKREVEIVTHTCKCTNS
jgi:hypothetical protein